MTNWPDKPLIRVLDGEVNEDGVEDELAYHVGDGAYALISEEHMDQTIALNAWGDMIVKWEEVTAVPTAALKRLQDAFRGIDVIEPLEPPLLEVLSYLPADKLSALDQAVTREMRAIAASVDCEQSQLMLAKHTFHGEVLAGKRARSGGGSLTPIQFPAHLMEGQDDD